MAASLPEWIGVSRRILDGLSGDEARAIAQDTARAVYRLS
jgi:predicted TIM-barrel fold metal-dependent hydrolase